MMREAFHTPHEDRFGSTLMAENGSHPTAIITFGLYIFTSVFTAVYIEERFILQTIYVIKTEILPFFKPKIRNLYTRAVIVARVPYVNWALIVLRNALI
jgi:hypothetical protein